MDLEEISGGKTQIMYLVSNPPEAKYLEHRISKLPLQARVCNFLGVLSSQLIARSGKEDSVEVVGQGCQFIELASQDTQVKIEFQKLFARVKYKGDNYDFFHQPLA